VKSLVAFASVCALAVPATATAAPLGAPVFVDATPHAVPNCASPDQPEWSFTHQTSPFGAPFAGGIMRLTFNQAMAYPESHPDIYTDVPLSLTDFTIPAGTVIWSYAAATDATNRVSVPFVCPAQGAAFDVRLEFFPTPTAPVSYAGRSAPGQWALLVFRVDEPSQITLEVGPVPMSYRFEDAASPTLLAAPGQTITLGTVNPGEHGVFLTPQLGGPADWSATVGAVGADGAAPAPGGGGYGTTDGTSTPKPRATKRPVMRKRPRIAGVPRVGRTVRCNRGTFAGATRYQIRWLRGGKLVPRRTTAAYRLGKADRGRRLVCQVRATNAAGALTVRSAPVLVRKAR
jgi:hypothetical protein